ncbi:unnamed protein product [Ectocarpus sp. 4 AP-2014]
MGLGQRKSKGGKGGHKTKNKEYKKGHATKNRRKDVDQIQDELVVEEEKGEEMVFEVDDDLPGQGQFYCTPCARHFTDQQTKSTHIRSKLHKRRMKDVAQEQYTQAEAERGAGMTKETYPPAHAVKSASAAASTAPPPDSRVLAVGGAEATGKAGAEVATTTGASGMDVTGGGEDEDDPDL